MKIKKIIRIAMFVILYLTACVILAIAVYLFMNNFSLENLTFIRFFDEINLFLYAAVALLLFVVWLINKRSNLESKVRAKNDVENAHWMTDREMKNKGEFTLAEWNNLSQIKQDALPVKAVMKGNKLNIVFYKAIHNLIVGATGSGKTTGYVSPTIQILARTGQKPSMIISDPKGELLKQHSQHLKNNGYRIDVLDLRDTHSSTKWNPLTPIYDKIIYSDQLKIENKNGQYVLGDKTFNQHKQAQDALSAKKQSLEDECFEDLNDIFTTLCPIQSKEKMWDEGAKKLIFGVALAMLEDAKNGILDREQYCFYNLFKNITKYAVDDCVEIKNYFNYLSEFSKAPGLAAQVLGTSERTLQGYLTSVSNFLTLFNDNGLCALTSKNEIDIKSYDERPVALFLKIPDEKDTRYPLVSVFVVQAYKALIAKSLENEAKGQTKNAELKRACYFILDEFGNLPRLSKMDSIITVGRSRRVYMTLVVQSYAQLENRYEREIAEIIKSNCNIKTFIGTTDKRTIEEFSDMCGKKKDANISYNTGNKNSNDFTTSYSVKERPLIYPSELQQLNSLGNMGNAIVNILGHPPLRSKFTPDYECNKYDMSDGDIITKSPEFFNEEEIFFDFAVRNEIFTAFDNLDLTNKPIPTPQKEKDLGGEEVILPHKVTVQDLQKVLIDKLDDLRVSLSDESFLRLKAAIETKTVMDVLQELKRSAKEHKNNLLLTKLIDYEFFLMKTTKNQEFKMN